MSTTSYRVIDGSVALGGKVPVFQRRNLESLLYRLHPVTTKVLYILCVFLEGSREPQNGLRFELIINIDHARAFHKTENQTYHLFQK